MPQSFHLTVASSDSESVSGGYLSALLSGPCFGDGEDPLIALAFVLELLHYVQPVFDHPWEQACETVVFDDECRAAPV
jgi:hypothetical protein